MTWSETINDIEARADVNDVPAERITRHYVDYLFHKNQGKHKAIIVKEYTLSKMPEAKVTAVLAETGESLPVEEYTFTD